MCDTCNEKGNCPFYEAGSGTCTYEFLASITKHDEKS